MRPPLVYAIGRGVPFLGICLGLQVLFESSAESPQLRGLSLLLGKVRALPSGVKLPHMGWNQIAMRDRKSTRLNSSHGYISYAVFCLKKNKSEFSSHLPPPRPNVPTRRS